MTEKSLFWVTNDTGDGSSSGYTSSELFSLFRSWCPAGNLGAVFTDVLNELEVTGTSSPVQVDTGHALVYGIPYLNTEAENVAVATPGSSTRVDYIVLRADWTAQTVRVTRIAGTEGAGAPSLTQTPNDVWDIPLATASITTSGVITVTDAREFIGNIQDGAVLTAMLADNAVTTAKLLDEAVTLAKLQDIATDSLIGRDTASAGVPEVIGLNATLSMDGSGNLRRAALTGDVTAAAGSNATTIANDAVTNAKAANMAQNTIKGRITASTGDPEDLSATQVRTIINVEAGADVTDAGNVGSSIHGAAAKTTPVSADTFPLIDSAASNVLKKVTLTNLATALGIGGVVATAWTPELRINGSTSGISIVAGSIGFYFDIGDYRFFMTAFSLSNKGAGTGNVTITASGDGLGLSSATSHIFADGQWANFNTSLIALHPYINFSSSTIDLFKQTAATTDVFSAQLTNTDILNNSIFNVWGVFEI